jgi:hypothetical protein
VNIFARLLLFASFFLFVGYVGCSPAYAATPNAGIGASVRSSDPNAFIELRAVSQTGEETTCYGHTTLSTGAIVRTLCPVGEAGQSICFYVTTAAVLTVNPQDTDIIVRQGTPQLPGVSIVSLAVAGSAICLFSDGAVWHTRDQQAQWNQGA